MNTTTSSIPSGRQDFSARKRATGLFPRVAYVFLGFFGLALLAFWPEYIVKLPHTLLDQNLHGAAMTLWFAMLIVQPLLIRYGHRELHRRIGRASYLLFPLAILTILLLTHHQLTSMRPAVFWKKGQAAALPLTTAGIFATSYVLAISHRRTMALHARYMVATSFALIGPVFSRLFLHYLSFVPGLAAFLLTDVVFVDMAPAWLAWRDRRVHGPARHAFRIVLAQQVAWQALFFVLLAHPPHAFMRMLFGFRGLPIP